MKRVVGRCSEVRQIGKFCFIFSPLFLACLQELGLQDSLLWGSNGEFRLFPLLLGSVIGTLWSGVGPMYLFIQSCVYIYMNLLILTLFFGYHLFCFTNFLELTLENHFSLNPISFWSVSPLPYLIHHFSSFLNCFGIGRYTECSKFSLQFHHAIFKKN